MVCRCSISGTYFLKFLIFFNSAVFTLMYHDSFKQILNQIEIMSIAITFAQLLRWFINEKSYKAYQNSFHKK